MSQTDPIAPVQRAPAGGVTYYPHPHPRSPFSEAVQVGDVLYLSAMIGLGPDGQLVDGFDAQVHQILRNTTDLLKRYDMGLPHIFKTTVMLTDMGNWGGFNRLYKPYFAPDRLPVRTAFGVAALAYGAEVEIEFWAKVPG